MAIYNLSFTFQDAQGRQTERSYLADVADETAILALLATWNTALQGFSKCGIVKYSYARETLVGSAADVDSNIDAGATFTWDSPLPIAPTLQIPDPIDAIKDGQGGLLLANAVVLAITDEYINNDMRLNRNNPTQPTAVRRATLDK